MSEEEILTELLAMSYKSLVEEHKNLSNLLRHYDAAVRHGLLKDISKSQLEVIVSIFKKAIRIKEKQILRETFIGGRI